MADQINNELVSGRAKDKKNAPHEWDASSKHLMKQV
jgi:hypothetical protein